MTPIRLLDARMHHPRAGMDMPTPLRTLRAHPMLMLFAAITTVLGAEVSRQLARNVELTNWSFTHWAFSYSHGFVKRGLAGEVLTWFVQPAAAFDAVYWIALFSSLAVAVALVLVFWTPFARTGSPGALALAVLATTHFATLQHHFYDVGRFDQYGLLLMLACLAAVDRARPIVAAAVIATLGTLGIVIHEAFIILFAPVILAYWAVRQGKVGWVTVLMAGVGCWLFAVAAVVGIQGRPAVSQTDYTRELIAAYGPWINDGSIRVLYGSVREESLRAVHNLMDVRRFVQHIVLTAFLLPTAALLVFVVRGASAGSSGSSHATRRTLLVLVAACSPLALYPIGIDFARWWALALTNLFVVIAYFAADLPDWQHAVDALARRRAVLWLALIVNFIAGPLGVAASPFPRIEPAVVALVTSVLHAVR